MILNLNDRQAELIDTALRLFGQQASSLATPPSQEGATDAPEFPWEVEGMRAQLRYVRTAVPKPPPDPATQIGEWLREPGIIGEGKALAKSIGDLNAQFSDWITQNVTNTAKAVFLAEDGRPFAAEVTCAVRIVEASDSAVEDAIRVRHSLTWDQYAVLRRHFALLPEDDEDDWDDEDWDDEDDEDNGDDEVEPE